jgi:hypothetical protein
MEPYFRTLLQPGESHGRKAPPPQCTAQVGETTYTSAQVLTELSGAPPLSMASISGSRDGPLDFRISPLSKGFRSDIWFLQWTYS